jgi:uncharacterized NAD(P)/FAD-binding protein YdhS/predicted metal-dependent enzyme (double-stranded beta helix superfamily)
MHALTGQLRELVHRLDAVGPAPTLVELADALEAQRLTLADVHPYVHANPRHYNRALVAVRESYELLVMTWLPGQASVPHDHAGSICAMQVLQGVAVEGSYRVAADGYVDLDYEQAVDPGAVTAGEDAGVHTVLNPADAPETLVTVHIYSPPLKTFRRYVARPQSPAVRQKPKPDNVPTVVVVGGGFSGSMTAAQVIRRARAAGLAARVIVVERCGAVGEGLAYGTRELAHLLNVPAGRMSAWPEQPDDFVQWAKQQKPNVRPEDFLPRQWYGEYVRETLLTVAANSRPVVDFEVQFDEVRRVARRPEGGWLVHLAHGDSLRADAVVLAIGHRPPSDPLEKRWSGPRTRFLADPWRPFAMSAVGPDDAVLILGAGLTAVDAVLSLAHPQRRARITIVSRRGLLPLAHSLVPKPPVDLQPLVAELLQQPSGVQALDLCRRLRARTEEVVAAGGDWRSVVDGVRPHTARLWQAMPIGERQKFLKRLRPFWEVHRHRMALAIGERFGELRDCDWIDLAAARVLSAHGEQDSVQVILAERGGRVRELQVAWVVNCTGPAPSNSAAANPAIGSLLVDHWLTPDVLGLGLETGLEGNAITSSGDEAPDLFVVGTLRKPQFWESTAVPELRTQAAATADRVVRVVTQAARQMGANI